MYDSNKDIECMLYERKIVEANEIANLEDARCSKDKKGLCPMLEDVIPDNLNECKYCNGLRNTWETRSWLLKKLNDSDIESLDYLDFEEKFPQLLSYISRLSDKFGYLHVSVFYSHIKQFGSYEKETEPIRLINEGLLLKMEDIELELPNF